MNINWYPGHMAKARRMIEENLKFVDMAVEILDARIPLSSKNPDISKILEKAGKPCFVILNKSDLADPAANKKWLDLYKKETGCAILFNAKANSSGAEFVSAVKATFAEKIERNAARGMTGKTIKIMVLGIPNAGKSTIINNLCGEKRAKTEDRPGVTRGKQWINAGILDILDTPGILWGRIENQESAVKLAVTGAIKDEILDTESLAVKLLEILKNDYENLLRTRYKLTETLPDDIHDLFRLICKKRGFILSGGEFDTARAAAVLLDEFRARKIGRITLD